MVDHIQTKFDDRKILIAIPTGEFARRADFLDYLNQLDKPATCMLMSTHGSSPASGRNAMIEQALLHKCTHIFFIDDDMAFKADTLVRLLAHDVDIVSGLYLQRRYPHSPIIFDEMDEIGNSRFNFLSAHSGLIPIVAAGLGCCLIKTSVFEKLEKPYIRLGEIHSDEWCDDIGFFKRLGDVGVKSFCDLDVLVGHIASMIIWPSKNKNDEWMVEYDTNASERVAFPQFNPLIYEKDGILKALQIEGWMSINELKWLAEKAKEHKVIVEFGSHCGRSTRALADNTEGTVYAVDPWTGEYFNEGGSFNGILQGSRLEDFTKNLKDHIETGRVKYFKGYSYDFYLPRNDVDFIFIDGDHRYESVLKDIGHAQSLFNGSSGIIAGHDYGNEWVGVKQAVDELFGDKVKSLETIWWVEHGER